MPTPTAALACGWGRRRKWRRSATSISIVRQFTTMATMAMPTMPKPRVSAATPHSTLSALVKMATYAGNSIRSEALKSADARPAAFEMPMPTVSSTRVSPTWVGIPKGPASGPATVATDLLDAKRAEHEDGEEEVEPSVDEGCGDGDGGVLRHSPHHGAAGGRGG